MTDWSTMKVLITGGSQGIGLGIAEGFAQAGAATHPVSGWPLRPSTRWVA